MKKAILVLFLIGLIVFLLPQPAWAICEGPLVPCGASEDNPKTPAIDESDPCRFCHLFVLLNNIIKFLLTCLLPIIGSFMLVGGGFYLLIAGPSPEKINRAKSIITGTVIGLIIVMISWVFLNTLFTYLGVLKWTGLKTWWEVECTEGKPRTCAEFGGFCGVTPAECRAVGGECHHLSPLDCAFPCCCIR